MGNLPHKSFERNMNHNYMILKQCDFFGQREDMQDYRVRMLLDNRIGGLLPVSHRIINGENSYYYEINSLQSMDRVYAKDEIDYKQLCTLLRGCIRLFESLEEYLLDGAQIILKPEYIYLNMDSLEPFFVYYPDYETEPRENFSGFIEDLLKKIDHTDEHAVMLAYQIYRYTRNTNYVLTEIEKMLIDKSQLLQTQEAEEQVPYDIKEPESDCSEFMKEPIPEPMCDRGTEEKVSNIKPDLIKSILCFCIAVCAAGILAGAHFLELYCLEEKQQICLYGAISMSVMAGVIYLAGYYRKRNRQREIEELEQEEIMEYQPIPRKESYSSSEFNRQPQVYNYGETICLQQLPSQERYLAGRINGEEIRIVLDKLPLTIGKMAGKADYIISDNTVSKLHAKIEEKNGEIYIEDLNSTNGTLRNGNMIGINEPVLLQSGDELTLGRVSLVFCG